MKFSAALVLGLTAGMLGAQAAQDSGPQLELPAERRDQGRHRIDFNALGQLRGDHEAIGGHEGSAAHVVEARQRFEGVSKCRGP